MATVEIDGTRPGPAIDGALWGTNLTNLASAAETVEHPLFVGRARAINVRVVRWPGGNNASAYDWKRNEMIRPGRRVPRPEGVDLGRILRFVHEIGAELSITVNFGTMTAQDAADLVEFLNGPPDSEWGRRRAELGFPEPLGVRFFEVGNEENQPHMWAYSWTAESPEKYFFGGEEERRGFYADGPKGDAFKTSGGPNQTYTLRFPPVRDVRAFWAPTQRDAEAGRWEEWLPVATLSGQPPDAKVFELDAERGVLRFGDGVRGAVLPKGVMLVEYTTYGHDGFLAFARAMRAAPSNVPIQIGAAVLPFRDGVPIADPDTMREIFSQMDFYVRHQYDSSLPVRAYGDYNARRQFAADRVDTLKAVYERVASYARSLGLPRAPAVAVTEWNLFLNEDFWHLNRTLGGAVFAAEWFVRVLNAGLEDGLPVWYANQFALGGGNLSLIRSQTNHSVAPMGYVFQGFGSWADSRLLPVAVDGPTARAYDREVPYVTAAAALSPDGRTLRVALVNNAETESVGVALRIEGLSVGERRLWRLAGDSPEAHNERDPQNIALREEPPASPVGEIALPPHSVVFLELAVEASAPRGP